jgi:hypothetical protein
VLEETSEDALVDRRDTVLGVQIDLGEMARAVVHGREVCRVC